MKESEDGTNAMVEALGKAAKAIMNKIKSQIEREELIETGNMPSGDATGSRVAQTNGRGKDHVERSWLEGDYEKIRESVDPEIKTLSRRLKLVKAKEDSLKWDQNKKRGKLSVKGVYIS